MRIYWEGRTFSYFPEITRIYERNYTLESLIENYDEITQNCIENFTYNDILKEFQEYLINNSYILKEFRGYLIDNSNISS